MLFFLTKVIDSRAVVLKSNGNYILCMTSSGHVYVWKFSQKANTENQDIISFSRNTKNANDDLNLQNLTTLINRESCQFILKNGEWLDCEVTDTGVPIISMSKNRSFFFSLKTKSWHLLPCLGTIVGQDSQLLLNSNAIHTNSKSSNSSNINGPLSQIQSRNKNSSISKTIETPNEEEQASSSFSKQDFTLTHLESQVNASIGLNSPIEYKFWLMTLVRYLVEYNNEEKLEEICNFLLGPCYSVNWNHTFLTFIKRDLLKEIILIIAENLNLQRIYSFYKQQLQLIDILNSKNSVLDRLVSSNRPDTSLRTTISSSKLPYKTSLEEASAKDTEAKTNSDLEDSKKAVITSENQMEFQVDNENESSLKSSETETTKALFKMPDIPENSNKAVIKSENQIEIQVDNENENESSLKSSETETTKALNNDIESKT